LGFGLIRFFLTVFIIFSQFGFSQELIESVEDSLKSAPSKKPNTVEYYKYWNPDRRVLDLRSEPQTFYGSIYYEVTYNNDGRIKTVTRIGEDRIAQETYHLIWNRSGSRSEYKIEFHTDGSILRLNDLIFSDVLSNVRPGWIADFKTRKDGRPAEVAVSDKLGFTYYYYHFTYTQNKDKGYPAEVVESSYYDKDGNFVGRHILVWEDGQWLTNIQYFDESNSLIESREFIHNKKRQETIRIISDGSEKELERRIIPFMPPDKYSYKLNWTGRELFIYEPKVDTLDLIPKSYLNVSYGMPLFVDDVLKDHIAGTGLLMSLGRRDLFTIMGMNVNVGLDVNWIDFKHESDSLNFQTLGYFFVTRIEPKLKKLPIPKNFELGYKLGGGLISPGAGVIIGVDGVFNLVPTPLAIGVTFQTILGLNVIEGESLAKWSSFGLTFGLNFDDKVTSLF